MAEYPSFETFARDIFLYASHLQMPECEMDKLDPIPLADDAFFVLDIFADAHCELFRAVFSKHEYETLQTDEQLFRFAIPRCLKLFDDQRYFYSMMLIASFLHEMMNFLRQTRVCHRFSFTVYKCFAAVFERIFKCSFESNGGWYGLQVYLVHIIDTLDKTKEKNIISALNESDPCICLRVARIIGNCDNVPKDFYINEYEASLLIDNDVKSIEKALKNAYYVDPLNLVWPPKDEILKCAKETKSAKYSSDLGTKMDVDCDSPSGDLNPVACLESSQLDPNTSVEGSSVCICFIAKKDANVSHPKIFIKFGALDKTTVEKFRSAIKEADPSFLEDVARKVKTHCNISDSSKNDVFNINEYDVSLLMDNQVKYMEKSLAITYDADSKKYFIDPKTRNMDGNLHCDLKAITCLEKSQPDTGIEVEGSSLSISLTAKKDGFDSEEMHPETFSGLEVYMSKILTETEMYLGTQEFLRQMELRSCPCCGIKCVQFSRELYAKQVNFAYTSENLRSSRGW